MLKRAHEKAMKAQKEKFLKILEQLSIDVKDDGARAYVEEAIEKLADSNTKDKKLIEQIEEQVNSEGFELIKGSLPNTNTKEAVE